MGHKRGKRTKSKEQRIRNKDFFGIEMISNIIYNTTKKYSWAFSKNQQPTTIN
jgi:hypothetical protein